MWVELCAVGSLCLVPAHVHDGSRGVPHLPRSCQQSEVKAGRCDMGQRLSSGRRRCALVPASQSGSGTPCTRREVAGSLCQGAHRVTWQTAK